jgi:hypothetical protein
MSLPFCAVFEIETYASATRAVPAQRYQTMRRGVKREAQKDWDR